MSLGEQIECRLKELANKSTRPQKKDSIKGVAQSTRPPLGDHQKEGKSRITRTGREKNFIEYNRMNVRRAGSKASLKSEQKSSQSENSEKSEPGTLKYALNLSPITSKHHKPSPKAANSPHTQHIADDSYGDYSRIRTKREKSKNHNRVVSYQKPTKSYLNKNTTPTHDDNHSFNFNFNNLNFNNIITSPPSTPTHAPPCPPQSAAQNNHNTNANANANANTNANVHRARDKNVSKFAYNKRNKLSSTSCDSYALHSRKRN